MRSSARKRSARSNWRTSDAVISPARASDFVADAGGAGYPLDRLQVAAAAGAFLAIGLQAVGSVMELGMTLGLFQLLGGEEGRRLQCRVAALFEVVVERARTG